MKNIEFRSSKLSVRPLQPSIAYISRDSEVCACQITMRLSHQDYLDIEKAELFNLAREVRIPLSNKPLEPAGMIEIEAVLQPSLLSTLLAHAPTADRALDYLAGRSSPSPEPVAPRLDDVIPIASRAKPRASSAGIPVDVEPLLYTESWFALSVVQTQGQEQAGYRTFWSYFLPSPSMDGNQLGERLGTAIVHFITDSLFADISPLFPASGDGPRRFIHKFVEQLAGDSASGDRPATEPEPEPSAALFPQLVHFFHSDSWPLIADPDTCSLSTDCRGQNGQWTCVAYTLEQDRQVLFYSIYPRPVASEQFATVCELLARANMDMVIGNFEMDLASGRILYKTSIDVSGDRLSPALLRRLVYINVGMMNAYLPVFKAVLEDGKAPEEAIADR